MLNRLSGTDKVHGFDILVIAHGKGKKEREELAFNSLFIPGIKIVHVDESLVTGDVNVCILRHARMNGYDFFAILDDDAFVKPVALLDLFQRAAAGGWGMVQPAGHFESMRMPEAKGQVIKWHKHPWGGIALHLFDTQKALDARIFPGGIIWEDHVAPMRLDEFGYTCGRFFGCPVEHKRMHYFSSRTPTVAELLARLVVIGRMEERCLNLVKKPEHQKALAKIANDNRNDVVKKLAALGVLDHAAH